ncbi:MAG: vanadium-dependent haloperoxidase [Burkholderiales bacterium]
MRHSNRPQVRRALCALGTLFLLAGGTVAAAPVVLAGNSPGIVATWYDVGMLTINVPAAATGTVAERRPVQQADIATMHVAMYDAIVAITRTHRPFAATTQLPTAGASVDAAAIAAAYGVLQGLYPARTAQYQSAYDEGLARIADGDAKARGVAIGRDIAAQVVAQRGDDGRLAPMAPYVPGTAPGQFRGTNPINAFLPSTKPLAMTSAAQFRAPGPTPLASARYATDFDETKALGGTVSTARTPQQAEAARFHTEPPPTFLPRNLRKFAASQPTLAENARLAAAVWVTLSDATIACFESKYHYNFWRPLTAIPEAGNDGNDATAADPAWKPFVPTPNHPEYPAAHGCTAGALAQTLRRHFGTGDVQFTLDSTVTGTTRHYDTVDALTGEVTVARIAGGMHFRKSVEDGIVLGQAVADWVADRNFQPTGP